MQNNAERHRNTSSSPLLLLPSQPHYNYHHLHRHSHHTLSVWQRYPYHLPIAITAVHCYRYPYTLSIAIPSNSHTFVFFNITITALQSLPPLVHWSWTTGYDPSSDFALHVSLTTRLGPFKWSYLSTVNSSNNLFATHGRYDHRVNELIISHSSNMSAWTSH